MLNIIVLASGNGTNLQAIIDAQNEGRLKNVRVLGVISDKNGGALEKGQSINVPSHYLPKKDMNKREYDEKLLEVISEVSGSQTPDLICLIGYMRILTPHFITKSPCPIINVHPSLIPAHSGKGMFGHHVHESVLKSGDTHTGMTIHYVDEGVDTGEILLQKQVKVESNDTVETLKAKVQNLEKEGYVEVLEKLSQ